MNIEKAPLVFPRAEYARRLELVKSDMRRRDIETLFVCSSANIIYLTGYTARSAYVPQGVVISLNEDQPTLIMRSQDTVAGYHQTFLDKDRVIGYPESLIGHSDKDGYDAVIDFVIERGLDKNGIGLETLTLSTQGRTYAAMPTVAKFQSRLPNARLVDCSKAVDWLRLVKSDVEIAIMREAAAISDAAIARAAEVIKPGVREADAVAEIVRTLIRGANGKAGTFLAPLFFVSSPRTGTSHIPWSDDILHAGSQVNLECGGMRHAYAAAIMRTFSIGKPSDRLRQMHEAEIAGHAAALKSARPGATCSDVASAFRNEMKRHGLDKESRCGYPIGIEWLEPTASLKVGDETVLKENMTFHLMLGNWVDHEFGYVLSDTIRVTDKGAETLTSAPRILYEV
ncbi:ectoine hydrolase [Bradyrhizobium sp. i1.4.4]